MPFSILTRNIFLFAFLSIFLSGCSISYSLGKSSDSSSSISNSSSGDDKKEKASETASVYMEDVSAATVLYVNNQTNVSSYQGQITSIANKHGITDWESKKDTFRAMGKGLKRAGVSKKDIPNLGYFKSISSSSNYSLVIDGYDE